MAKLGLYTFCNLAFLTTGLPFRILLFWASLSEYSVFHTKATSNPGQDCQFTRLQSVRNLAVQFQKCTTGTCGRDALAQLDCWVWQQLSSPPTRNIPPHPTTHSPHWNVGRSDIVWLSWACFLQPLWSEKNGKGIMWLNQVPGHCRVFVEDESRYKADSFFDGGEWDLELDRQRWRNKVRVPLLGAQWTDSDERASWKGSLKVRSPLLTVYSRLLRLWWKTCWPGRISKESIWCLWRLGMRD